MKTDTKPPFLEARLAPFREIWLVDFEFDGRAGERPVPVCLAARELRSGRQIRLWQDQFGQRPPYSLSADSLFVAYFASAELGCHLSLGWPMPERILDLFTEFRCLTNGLSPLAGNSLLGALIYYGLDSIGAEEKAEMINLILRGGWSREEIRAILDYCESDVAALARLLPVMLHRIDLARALFRGRYMAAVAWMEAVGIPADVQLFTKLQAGWPHIQDRLIADIDAEYGVYDGRTFKQERFQRWLTAKKIPWPMLPSGQLDLSDRTFRDMAITYPVGNLRQLRHSLSKLRLNKLAIGSDGHNRCLLSPFRSKTGRNQPSNNKFIFGPGAWLRGLIKPGPGWAVAYLDFEAQEYGAGAGLSRDPRMLAAYLTGDPYLAFAKQATAAPEEATKKSHEKVRNQYKQGSLSTMYGIEAFALALRLGIHPLEAKSLLESHHDLYTKFWEWSDNALNHCLLHGWQETVFGWRRHLGRDDINVRSLRNFWIQANAAEMLRLAAILGTEAGIRICAPVHDAFLITAPIDQIRSDIGKMCGCMKTASRIVLGGFELRIEVAAVVCYPGRYQDKRGVEMWNTVMRLLDTL